MGKYKLPSCGYVADRIVDLVLGKIKFMKSVLSLFVFFLALNVWSQCPDQNTVDHQNLVAKYPSNEFYKLLADYHAKKCFCVSGSSDPQTAMNDLNVAIDRINATGKVNYPKAVRCISLDEKPADNYIKWEGKEESFSKVVYIGNLDSGIPKQLHLNNLDADGRLVKNGKKMQYIRLSGFQKLEYQNEIKLNEENGLIHVGIIDIENDHYYYTAKSASLIGLGNNKYKLEVHFYFTGSAGNDFQQHPNYPTYPNDYKLTAYFEFNPIFQME